MYPREIVYETVGQDDQALAEQANAQLSDREVIWVCPYCYNEVGHEPTRPCCGEMGHEIPIDADTGEELEPF